MSRITRVLLSAVFVIALCKVVTSSALATEDPFYKLEGKRLAKGESRLVGLKAVSNQVLNSPGIGITITCTGIAAKAGATINGSNAPEPGTSEGQIEYSGCTVTGNGEKCVITSVAGAKDKKVVTNALKDELELSAEAPPEKILDLFVPAKGASFVELKFEPEAGGECKFKTTAVEGSVDVEILNSKKEPVEFGVNENEEEFGFIKALPNGTKGCKLKEGKLDKCVTTGLKAFLGAAATLGGTAEAFLTGADTGKKFGVFSTSSMSAVEAPFYRQEGKRLEAGETRELGLKAVGNQVFNAPSAGIAITCTGVATKAGATINGSKAGEPGTSAGQIEYSGCTVEGNGEECPFVTSVAGAKDGKIVTNALKDELVLAEEAPKKGTKLLDSFKPAKGTVFVTIKFEPEAGGGCIFSETPLEGSFDVEILNSKKETVAFEEHETEEAFGYIKPLPNGTRKCKIKSGKLDKCTTSSLKGFGGFVETLEGTAEAFLTSGENFGVFSK